jgi:hypothetical protein
MDGLRKQINDDEMRDDRAAVRCGGGGGGSSHSHCQQIEQE